MPTKSVLPSATGGKQHGSDGGVSQAADEALVYDYSRMSLGIITLIFWPVVLGSI